MFSSAFVWLLVCLLGYVDCFKRLVCCLSLFMSILFLFLHYMFACRPSSFVFLFFLFFFGFVPFSWLFTLLSLAIYCLLGCVHSLFAFLSSFITSLFMYTYIYLHIYIICNIFKFLKSFYLRLTKDRRKGFLLFFLHFLCGVYAKKTKIFV